VARVNKKGRSWLAPACALLLLLSLLLSLAPGASATVPSAPTGLQAEGQTNPTHVTDLNPELSAVYVDPDAGDNALKAWVQVGTFAGDSSLWDSDWLTITKTANGARCEDISYGYVTPSAADASSNSTEDQPTRTADYNYFTSAARAEAGMAGGGQQVPLQRHAQAPAEHRGEVQVRRDMMRPAVNPRQQCPSNMDKFNRRRSNQL